MCDVVVNFRVHISELLQDPVDRLTQTIDAEIGLYAENEPEERVVVGHIQAHLFHIYGVIDHRYSFLDLYDCQSRHLSDSLSLIYDDEEQEFRECFLKKAGIDIGLVVEWHLNLTRMDIHPEHRGNRYGVRALSLFRTFIQRSGLVVTAKAHPEALEAPRSPPPAEVKKLRAYYASDRKLGFKQYGKPREGWLIANWST